MEREMRRPNPINSSRRAEIGAGSTQLPESPRGPMEFLSRSWSVSALEVSRALHTAKAAAPSTTRTPSINTPIPEESSNNPEKEECQADNSQFSFASSSSATSQLVLERIMSQSEVSPLTSGRLSHSSGPLNGGGSFTETDSPPISPSDDFDDVVKVLPAWAGRDLFNGDKHHYFGLKTETKRVIEFECRNEREYEIWTQGISRLVAIAAERKQKNSTSKWKAP